MPANILAQKTASLYRRPALVHSRMSSIGKKIALILLLCIVRVETTSIGDVSNAWQFSALSTSSAYGEALRTVASNMPTAELWQYYPYLDKEQYPPAPTLNVAAYLLIDINSSYILASYRETKLHATASLAKLMTAYIVFQKIEDKQLSLSDSFELKDDSIFSTLPSDASRMGLREGDQLSIDELLQGLLVVSGNDAAIMLANIVYSSEEAFVKQMNIQANMLGLYSTRFADSSGLSENNISSALDLAVLASALFNFSSIDIISYSSIAQMQWRKTKRSTNVLLGNYEGIEGLKTGYIEAAGFNFIASAQRKVLENKFRRVVVVILGAEGSNIAEGIANRAEAAKILLNYAYNEFEYLVIDYQDKEVTIWGAAQESVLLDSIAKTIILPKGWGPLLYTRVALPPFIWAPIEAGEIFGTVKLYHRNIGNADSTTLGTLEMAATSEVVRGSWIKMVVDYIKMLWMKIVG